MTTASVLPVTPRVGRRISMGEILSLVSFTVGYLVVCGLIMDKPSPLVLGDLTLPAVALSAFSVYCFLRSGGALINASSAASYSVLLFFAFPAMYAALGLNPMAHDSDAWGLLAAISYGYLFLLILSVLRRPALNGVPTDMRSLKVKPASGREALGLALFAVAIAATLLDQGAYAAPTGIAAIFFIGDAVFRQYSVLKRTMVAALVGFLLIAYVSFVFEGFGRLVLGMLFCGLAIITSFHYRKIGVKLTFLIGTVLALPILAATRLTFLAETRGVQAEESEGLGSVVGPLVSFSRILQAVVSGDVLPSWGSSFFATAVFFIPRSIWEEKPVGFGAEMVAVTRPELFGVPGFSDAGTFVGELVWNFGLYGAIVGIVVVALLCWKLDSALSVQRLHNQSWKSICDRLILVTLAASSLNYFWGGSQTLVVRSVGVLAIFAMVRIVFSERRVRL